MSLQANANEILVLLEQLKNLDHDPEQFAKTKRRLFDHYILSLPQERQQQARDFQQEIDTMVVVSGTPFRAISVLLNEIIDRCDAMDGFNNQLKNPSST